ncbi:MAG: hypothetical protein Q8P58_02655 [Candidatus Adlerbacteria bacterium]|nr:hypothetical protein [Candidatus Adlerbacteria bacterium]
MVLYGTVDDRRRPYVRVEAPGDHSVLFVVDTGFNGTLLVNRHIMYRLGLNNCTIDTDEKEIRQVELGDYGITQVMPGIVNLIWFGEEQLIDILLTTRVPQHPPGEDEPVGFIGTKLLADCHLTIDFVARTLQIQKGE